jgi:hypothetical protein
MRIDNDLRRCVVFLGYEDDTPNKGGIQCVGTGFLFHYKGMGYLVTVKHVAKQLDDNPFIVRINRSNMMVENLHADYIKWAYHPDNSVDVAVVESHFGVGEYASLYLRKNIVSEIGKDNIGIGDMCYTIGLFRLMYGQGRNLPIVHSGNIAMFPGDERVPVKDRLTGETEFVEAYLVEAQTLDGLSGAPVFARPTLEFPVGRDDRKGILGSILPLKNVYLIGIWQGAWNAPPDKILSAEIETGKIVRVPVGMGVVVPITKLIELLELPELKKRRETIIKANIHAADLDAVIPDTENPQHKEEFNSLITAAVKKKSPTDET